MNILVTGGAGVAASCLYQTFPNAFYSDVVETESTSNLKNYFKCDLSNFDSVKKLTKNKDLIIHLGAESNPNSSWNKILKNNIISTKNLFDSAFQNNVQKIIFASSNRVYGGYELEHNRQLQLGKTEITEKTHVFPINYYAISKVFGENLAKWYSLTTDIKFYVLRIGALLSEKNDNPYAYADLGVKNKKW